MSNQHNKHVPNVCSNAYLNLGKFALTPQSIAFCSVWSLFWVKNISPDCSLGIEQGVVQISISLESLTIQPPQFLVDLYLKG